MTGRVKAGDVTVGGGCPLVLIAGPCVIEGVEAALAAARRIKTIAGELSIPFIYKSSYEKANRTSIDSFRGLGPAEGLRILDHVRQEVGVPVLSDVHTFSEIDEAAAVLDVLQIPAFLCRQTDFVVEVAGTGKPVNIKKGQFLAPWEMERVIEKAASTGNKGIMVTERGVTFGYNNLVSDMRSLVIMKRFGVPIVFDATHSVQLPGGAGKASGGQREYVAPLARAAVATGVDAVFVEVHEDPDNAPCDGPNSLKIDDLPALLGELLRIREALSKPMERGVDQ
ncbi:3-deoxy-8-phosphooctulonate synthase [Thermodesulfobacteriota bacterium]